jgi:hypothetical protein
MRSRRKRREEVSVGRGFGRGFRWAAGGVSLGCLGGSGVAPKTIVFGGPVRDLSTGSGAAIASAVLIKWFRHWLGES